MELLIGNIQTENQPLEIGLNALEVIQKNRGNGFSERKYANKVGINKETIRKYIRSAEVYKYIQCHTGVALLCETIKLYEISRCPQSDWLWLHNMVIAKELSKTQTESICKAVKELDGLTAVKELRELFNIEQVKKKTAEEVLENRNRAVSNTKPALTTANEFYQALEPEAVFYSYNIQKDEIIEETVNMHKLFLEELNNQNTLSKSTVNQAADEVLRKKQHSRDAAEQTANYYREEKNNEELQERRRIEKEKSKEVFDLWLSGMYAKDIASNLGINTTSAEKYLETEKQEKLDEGLFFIM